MLAEIEKSSPSGVLTAPPSKSMAHRLLICAGLAKGTSKIENISLSQDVLATLDCLKALGADCSYQNGTVTVTGVDFKKLKGVKACCRESGSTLRFFIPIFWLLNSSAQLCGSEYLFSRPLGIYREIADKQGLGFKLQRNCVELRGSLNGGEFSLQGNISSQFISGLLFALPFTNKDSTIKLIPPIESRSYIDMTLSALKAFGISASWIDDFTIFIKSNQRYRPCDIKVEGDYSNAAFFAALNELGGEIELNGLNADSLQGDSIIFDYLNRLNSENAVLDVSNCPDIAPILITVAAAKNGAKFIGTKRLEMKESNRGRVIAEELRKFGADIMVEDNEITVNKCILHKPMEILYGHNDHRIVMSLAVLLTLYSGTINGCEAVNKSYPEFFDELSRLKIGVKLYDK